MVDRLPASDKAPSQQLPYLGRSSDQTAGRNTGLDLGQGCATATVLGGESVVGGDLGPSGTASHTRWSGVGLEGCCRSAVLYRKNGLRWASPVAWGYHLQGWGACGLEAEVAAVRHGCKDREAHRARSRSASGKSRVRDMPFWRRISRRYAGCRMLGGMQGTEGVVVA